MTDYELMEQFTAFARLGTLNEVAKMFETSAPTITRNMKRVEDYFDLTLFDRRGSRISLNETGRYAAREAAAWLSSTRNMLNNVRAFAHSESNIAVGYAASLALSNFIDHLSARFPHAAITTERKDTEELTKGLLNYKYQLILLPFIPKDGLLASSELMTERLVIRCPLSHPFAEKRSLTLEDLRDQTLLCAPAVGFWEAFLRQCLPSNRYIRPAKDASLEELLSYGEIPQISSDLTEQRNPAPGNYRVNVPVSDNLATLTYYIVCREEDRAKFL